MTNERLSDLPPVASVEEVAAYLGIARNTVYNLIASGDLWARKVGRRLIVPRTAVENFLSPDIEMADLAHPRQAGLGADRVTTTTFPAARA